ncbi:MAG: winged helix DNA-binding domain-containing protein [Streptosporangiales bacterium]|nr:winged helix DNA-binding domain-containing protein [Streptosporangiales bacterium]
MPPTITDEQRRARLAVRHRLTPQTAGRSPVDAAEAVLALHATDPASVFLSARARGNGTAVEDVEQALYVERSVVRMLGMRRTMFVTPTDLVPVVHAACTKAVAAKERTKLLEFVAQTGFTTSPQRWLRRVERDTLDALRARGEATASELTEDVPELGRKILVGSGRWQAEQGAATRVLFLLAADGEAIRGRPRGSWLSTQYRWASTDTWLPTGPLPDLDTDAARSTLARRWLWAYGPATEADLKWWTGWTLTQTRRALAGLDVVEVELSNGTGYLLADDVDQVATPPPWVALLPALDPTAMGWTGRDWFLGPHRDALFDDVGTSATDAVHEAAGALQTWLGPARITPRFRTPARARAHHLTRPGNPRLSRCNTNLTGRSIKPNLGGVVIRRRSTDPL